MLTKSEEQRKKLLFGNGQGISDIGKYSGIVDRAFVCVDKSIIMEEELLSQGLQIDGKTPIFAVPEWLYKNNGKSKGVVHVARVIVEHLNYLLSYMFYLGSLSPEEKVVLGAEKYSIKENYEIPRIDSLDDENGYVERAIAQYKYKLEQIKQDHLPYIALGVIPDDPK